MNLSHETGAPKRRPHDPLHGPNLQHCGFSDCQALYEAMTLMGKLAMGYMNQPRMQASRGESGTIGYTAAGEFFDDLMNWLFIERDRVADEVRFRLSLQKGPDSDQAIFLLQCAVHSTDDMAELAATAATLALDVDRARRRA